MCPRSKKYQLKVLKVLHAISIQLPSTCIVHCASSSTAFRSNESILMNVCLVGVHYGVVSLISMLGPKLTVCYSECQHIHNNQLAREQHTWLSLELPILQNFRRTVHSPATHGLP